MKQTIIISFIWLLWLPGYSQQNLEARYDLEENNNVYIDLPYAKEIELIHNQNKEIVVEVEFEIDNGKGNSQFSLESNRLKTKLEITSSFGNYSEKIQNCATLSTFENKGINIIDSNGTTIVVEGDKEKPLKKNCTLINELSYKIYLPKSKDVLLKSDTAHINSNYYEGNLEIDGLSGDITLRGFKGNVILKTLTGALDVTINDAEIRTESLYGSMYSNLNCYLNEQFNKDNEEDFTCTIGNGSSKLFLETVSGDIFLRKM